MEHVRLLNELFLDCTRQPRALRLLSPPMTERSTKHEVGESDYPGRGVWVLCPRDSYHPHQARPQERGMS
jgi:hypothetical protein